MKEDPFVENLNKTIAFVKRHTQILLVSAVIVVVVFIGTKAFMDYRAKQEVEANRLLFQAQSSVEKNELDKSMAALDELLTKYGGTQAALSGEVIRASVYCAQGKYDEAIQAYKDLLAEQQGVLALEINFSLANAYQSKGLYDEALRIYAQLDNDPEFSRPYEMLYLKGRALEELNRYRDAVDAYQSIPSDSESYFYSLARERLEWLRAMEELA